MIKICQDTSLMRFNSFIETYMEHCAEVTPKLFNWIDSKSKTKFDYLCANFSPFDSEGMTSYCNSDTLFILGNSIYETDHVDCHKSEKTLYYIFTSIASGFFYSLMTPRYNEELCYALSDALYFEYLEETKSDIKDVEKESVRCLYRKYNYRIGEKSFDEFVSDFHSLYKKRSIGIILRNYARRFLTITIKSNRLQVSRSFLHMANFSILCKKRIPYQT